MATIVLLSTWLWPLGLPVICVELGHAGRELGTTLLPGDQGECFCELIWGLSDLLGDD